MSGPLLDRIDLHIWVDALSCRDFMRGSLGDSSKSVRQRVMDARKRQSERLGEGRVNASMGEADYRSENIFSGPHLSELETIIDELGLSARALSRVFKVARTIADLDGAPCVEMKHFQESASFRLKLKPRPDQGHRLPPLRVVGGAG